MTKMIIPKAEYPNQYWYLDFYPITETEEGVVYMYLLVDGYSHFVLGQKIDTELNPIHSINLIKESIAEHAIEITKPLTLITDLAESYEKEIQEAMGTKVNIIYAEELANQFNHEVRKDIFALMNGDLQE